MPMFEAELMAHMTDGQTCRKVISAERSLRLQY